MPTISIYLRSALFVKLYELSKTKETTVSGLVRRLVIEELKRTGLL
jgi:hypothetical protein